jgi:hypothetical protein
MASSNSMSVRRIDRQRFDSMLNILPPTSWMGIGGHAESFKMSEGVNADTAIFYCRIGTGHFELESDIRSSHGAVVERCRAFLQSGGTETALAQAAS